jgi:hypothetical protein
VDLTSPHAFWLIRNGVGEVPPPMARDRRCDVVVIGAGITGALIADALTPGISRSSPSIAGIRVTARPRPRRRCCSTRSTSI